MPDPVADILNTVQTSPRVRAAAWDAAYSSDDPSDVAERLKALPIGDSARAKLWDARFDEPEVVETKEDAPPPAPKTMFGSEPMTGREFLAADATNRSRVSQLAGEHPWATTGVLALAGGLPAMGRSVASGVGPAVRSAISSAAPAAKYEAIKYGLENNPLIPIPAAVSTPIAMVLSGGRRSKAATPSEPASVAAPSVPPASSPVAPAPSVAPNVGGGPPAQPVTRALSPQRIQNDLGIQARRQSVTLTEPQYKAATEMVQQGATPADAVAEVARRTAPVPSATSAPDAVPAATAPSATKAKAPKRAKLTADEADEYLRLTGKGMSHEEATAALMDQRKLAAKLGTPTPESVRRRVSDRNVSGRWPEGK